MIRVLTAALVATSVFATPAVAQGPRHCPPGLAKKSPACVPPGLAKSWRAGDRYEGRWEPIAWWRHDLPRPAPNEQWIRVGDTVLKVDEETRAIIDIIRLAAVVLSN